MKKNHSSSAKGPFWLYGHHAVKAALSNPDRTKTRLFLLSDEPRPKEAANSLATTIVDKQTMEKTLPQGAIHQGIALEVKPLEPLSLDDIIHQVAEKPFSTIVILDGVTDPHNIGAILRSMAAFDSDALIVTDKNAPAETAAMAKAASGALDIVPLIRVTNLARTLEKLKQAGFWIIGMEGTAQKSLRELDITKKIAIILGSEGEGMRRLTLESCDFLAKLPISSKMESLNVSNAAAIALYELSYKLKA